VPMLGCHDINFPFCRSQCVYLYMFILGAMYESFTRMHYRNRRTSVGHRSMEDKLIPMENDFSRRFWRKFFDESWLIFSGGIYIIFVI
jgi:hypothetical protein